MNGINGMGGSLAWARGTTGSCDYVLVACGMEGTRRDAADMDQVVKEEEEEDTIEEEEEELVVSAGLLAGGGGEAILLISCDITSYL